MDNSSLMALLGVCLVVIVWLCWKLWRGSVAQEPSSLLAESIFESMTNIMVLIDSDFNIQRMNMAGLAFFEKPLEEVLGLPFTQLMGEEVCQDCAAELEAAGGKLTKKMELEVNGRKAYLHVTVSQFCDRYGNPTGYAFLGTDITESLLAAEKIKEYADELERSNEVLEHFAYIASHDLKEPLRMVNGFVTLMERRLIGKLDKTSEEYFDYVKDGVKRMYSLIESVLEISQFNQQERNRKLIDTRELVQGLVGRLTDHYEKEKLVEIGIGSLPALMANPSHVETLFSHLLENSIKYNNSPKAIVHIDCIEENNQYIFSVRDNGIGIDPAFHDHIFKMFKRLHTRVKYEGTGMGLSICKRIVEGLKGKIWVESLPGNGTVVNFSLPVPREERSTLSAKSSFSLRQAV